MLVRHCPAFDLRWSSPTCQIFGSRQRDYRIPPMSHCCDESSSTNQVSYSRGLYTITTMPARILSWVIRSNSLGVLSERSWPNLLEAPKNNQLDFDILAVVVVAFTLLDSLGQAQSGYNRVYIIKICFNSICCWHTWPQCGRLSCLLFSLPVWFRQNCISMARPWVKVANVDTIGTGYVQ